MDLNAKIDPRLDAFAQGVKDEQQAAQDISAVFTKPNGSSNTETATVTTPKVKSGFFSSELYVVLLAMAAPFINHYLNLDLPAAELIGQFILAGAYVWGRSTVKHKNAVTQASLLLKLLKVVK